MLLEYFFFRACTVSIHSKFLVMNPPPSLLYEERGGAKIGRAFATINVSSRPALKPSHPSKA